MPEHDNTYAGPTTPSVARGEAGPDVGLIPSDWAMLIAGLIGGDTEARAIGTKVRLYLSNVTASRPGYLLIGEADRGDAVTARNCALADDIAAALRRAGYRSAVLVLDADEITDADRHEMTEAQRRAASHRQRL